MAVELDNVPRSQQARTRAHPGPSLAPARNRFLTSQLPLLFIISITLPDTEAKEAVIFEQFGQLAGVTAYLHVHVELSISSVEAQLEKYR
jgi:hypothetical protein